MNATGVVTRSRSKVVSAMVKDLADDGRIDTNLADEEPPEIYHAVEDFTDEILSDEDLPDEHITEEDMADEEFAQMSTAIHRTVLQRKKIISKGGQMYVIYKEEVVQVANFVISVYGHHENLESVNTYVLKCTLPNTQFFYLDLSISDLDSFKKFYSKFLNRRRMDAGMNEEMANKIKFHRYIFSIVEAYGQNDSKQQIIIAEKKGFQYSKAQPNGIYILGPNSYIPKTANIPVIWLGPTAPFGTLYLGEKLTIEDMIEIMDLLEEYHEDNFATFLALISYTWLTMNSKFLRAASFNLPTFHLVGEIGTGKSRAADHFRCLLPYLQISKDEPLVSRDGDVTPALLKSMLGEERPPVILDPTPPYAKEEINSIIDNFFQGNYRKRKNMAEKDPSTLCTGLVWIWPNEKASLLSLDPTALSKIVIGVHERHEEIHLENKSKINSELMLKVEKSSGFFHCFIQSISIRDLISSQNYYNSLFIKGFETKFDRNFILKCSRMFQNFSLIMAGLRLFLEKENFPEALVSYYCRCLYYRMIRADIPMLLHRMKEVMVPSKIECRHNLVEWLEAMPVRAFFSKVGFSPESVNFSVELLKEFCENTQDIKSYNITRSFFLSPLSKTDWFKRGRYGEFLKLNAYRVPERAVPDSVHLAIRKKIQDYAPLIKKKEIGKGHYYYLLQKHFDLKYL